MNNLTPYIAAAYAVFLVAALGLAGNAALRLATARRRLAAAEAASPRPRRS